MKSRAALGEEERKEKEEQEEAVIAAFLGRTSTEGIRRPASSAAHDGKGEDVREKVEFLLKTEEERTALAARNAASGGQAVSGLDDLLPLSFAVSHEHPSSSCQITSDGPRNLLTVAIAGGRIGQEAQTAQEGGRKEGVGACR